MDSREASSAIEPFVEFLTDQNLNNLAGLEMGCGKGRNVIDLAKQPIIKKMVGFDFSEVAVVEAKRRAKEAGVESKTEFLVADATEHWPFTDATFDFCMDLNASTDIETPSGRKEAIEEMKRVLKRGGYFLLYVMSAGDEYHTMTNAHSPAEEKNAFYHPLTGKFEKIFDETELTELYGDLKLIEAKMIEKTTEFFGKKYQAKSFWRIYQK